MQKVVLLLLFLVLGVQHVTLLGYNEIGNEIFYSLSFLLFCLSIVCGRIYIDMSKLLILTYVLFLFTLLCIRGNIYGADRFYMILSCWLLAFVLIHLLENYNIHRYLVWTLIGWACIELLIGIGQLIGLCENSNNLFRMGGAFGNPGAFAGYISVSLPMVLSLYLFYRKGHKNENISIVLVMVITLMVYVIAMSVSRGAWIASILGAAVVIESHFHYTKRFLRKIGGKRRNCIVGLFGVSVILVSVALYEFKADSADGRAFIWKVSISSPRKNVLIGDGIASFEANYGKWQRDYFAAGKGTEHEKRIADYVTCAYNEFLETYIEQGIVGELFLFAILCLPLYVCRKRQSSIDIGARGSYIGFLVLCLVSYPLSMPLMYLHLIVVYALLVYDKSNMKKEQRYVQGLKYAYLIPAAVVTYQALFFWYGMSQTKEALKMTIYGDYKEAIKIFDEVFPIMSNNGVYLLYYGSVLQGDLQFARSAEILKMAEQKCSDPTIYIKLGICYEKENNVDKAIYSYMNAIHLVPSRLYPRYMLALLLEKKGCMAEAIKVAEQILRMDDKVPSIASKQIRDKMHLLIKSANLKSQQI